MKWKVTSVACACIALLSLGWAFLVTHRSGRVAFDSASVVTQIKPLNQLTTVRYSIQRVVGVNELKAPFGEESLLLMVQGEVLAGVNLSELTQDDVIYLSAREVAIRLPPPKITEAFLDEKDTRVWDRHITWWTPWVPYNPDLEHQARLSAVDEIRKAALSMGILQQATRNAQISIRDLLNSLGISAKFKSLS